MRRIHVLAAALLAVGVVGCGEKPVASQPKKAHPAVVEAQSHFTFKGKPIPPFFIADFYGGPGASDFWLRETGSRISAVAVEGLFIKGDGSYVGSVIEDRRDAGGFISFYPPSDEPDRPRGNGYFGYKFVGTTPSGVTVLENIGNTGGSGTCVGVVFIRFEMESIGVTEAAKQERLVMRFLGAKSWGDRVYRDVKLAGNELRLGPETSHLPGARDSLDSARTILLN